MSNHRFRSHGAHGGKTEAGKGKELAAGDLPSHLLCPESEHVRGLLEELDDVIFAAIMGDSEALDRSRTLWSQVVAELGWELVDESREQYLRYAIDVTRRFENEDLRSPERAIAALEIISLLTKN